MKVCVFAPASRFDSELRKHLPACWLHLTIWLPNGQGAKGLGKQVYASETVRVLVYVSFPFVRSDYVISTGVGFRVTSGVVASP